MKKLNVSIVLYKHTFEEVRPLIETIKKSVIVSTIYIIDNSPSPINGFNELDVTYKHSSTNLGYGKAHNLALRESIAQQIPYHLVLNPDIDFEPFILTQILQFMDKNTEVGHLMPKVFYPNGEMQYLCKLIPTPFDLFIRRFLPISWAKWRVEKFEMRNTGYNKIMDVPYLSGSFMFLRTKALEEVGLFDERFFMYPEDIDLTRRIHRKYRTVFFPNVSIIHHHAKSSYLSIKMLVIHSINLIKYFNKWGWIFDSERRELNKKIQKSIQSGSFFK